MNGWVNRSIVALRADHALHAKIFGIVTQRYGVIIIRGDLSEVEKNGRKRSRSRSKGRPLRN